MVAQALLKGRDETAPRVDVGLKQERQEIEARYSNCLEIGQNAFEFVLDFGQSYQGEQSDPRFHTRIVTGPFYAKYFSALLCESVRRYEEEHGVIPEQNVQGEDR